ncbi:SpoIIE family protein phosphatase [Streptomyces sp. NPDC001404]|uniref:SpoIIE family protein phosphatase n=1 Tax=Streptomyces sp. NPDC001404 TaxID=3364571 RepID=UPI0036B69B09
MTRIEPCEGGWSLLWSSAGHPPPLGADPRLPRHDHRYVLPPGVTVPMFTDGLYEHPKRDMDDALRTVAEVAVAHAGRPLDVLGKAVADARPSDGHDDMAVLALRAPGRPAKCGA